MHPGHPDVPHGRAEREPHREEEEGGVGEQLQEGLHATIVPPEHDRSGPSGGLGQVVHAVSTETPGSPGERLRTARAPRFRQHTQVTAAARGWTSLTGWWH